MNCRVSISGGAQGGANYVSDGEISFCGGGFELKYFIDGDTCLLSFDGEMLRQNRRGSLALNLVFKNSTSTVCTLGEGELCGEFSIYTKELSVETSDGGIKIKINYDCGGEENLLFLTAEKIQEKK